MPGFGRRFAPDDRDRNFLMRRMLTDARRLALPARPNAATVLELLKPITWFAPMVLTGIKSHLWSVWPSGRMPCAGRTFNPENARWSSVRAPSAWGSSNWPVQPGPA